MVTIIEILKEEPKEVLRALIQHSGQTAMNVADACNFSRASFSRWLSGEAVPTVTDFASIFERILVDDEDRTSLDFVLISSDFGCYEGEIFDVPEVLSFLVDRCGATWAGFSRSIPHHTGDPEVEYHSNTVRRWANGERTPRFDTYINAINLACETGKVSAKWTLYLKRGGDVA